MEIVCVVIVKVAGSRDAVRVGAAAHHGQRVCIAMALLPSSCGRESVCRKRPR